MAKTYKMGLLPGDGTGPEVLREGIKVLNAAATKFGFKFETTPYDIGGERYMKTGEILPDSVVDEFRKQDVLFLGAIGHPDVKPGILEKGILLKARFELEQYINLRPVKLFPGVETPIKNKGPKEIDFVIVRENSGDVYTGCGGIQGKGTPGEVAIQNMIYTRREVDRCLRYAFEYARKRNKDNKVTLVGKTNVLTYVFDLWERAFHEMGEKEFPDITRDYAHVDATTMWMVKNPEWFDVAVTTNLFGDIITDLGAMIQGGMGIAAGGNINPFGVSMFEPIGGSAPKYTGLNIINPLACILAGGLLLDHIGEAEAAKAVEASVVKYINAPGFPGLSASEIKAAGVTTQQMGDAVAAGL